jgi:hypothetical protein
MHQARVYPHRRPHPRLFLRPLLVAIFMQVCSVFRVFARRLATIFVGSFRLHLLPRLSLFLHYHSRQPRDRGADSTLVMLLFQGQF